MFTITLLNILNTTAWISKHSNLAFKGTNTVRNRKSESIFWRVGVCVLVTHICLKKALKKNIYILVIWVRVCVCIGVQSRLGTQMNLKLKYIRWPPSITTIIKSIAKQTIGIIIQVITNDRLNHVYITLKSAEFTNQTRKGEIPTNEKSKPNRHEVLHFFITQEFLGAKTNWCCSAKNLLFCFGKQHLGHEYGFSDKQITCKYY